MKLKQSVKMAWAAIISNKMRSFLTMLGIIIGVMAVTLLISLVQGGIGNVTESMDEVGGDQIIVSVGDIHKKLTFHELEALEGSGGIKRMSPYLSGQGMAKAGGNSCDVSIMGITPAYQEVQGLDIQEGRNITDLDQEEGLNVCIIGTGAATDLFGTTQVLNNSIRIMGYDYRIVGMLEEEDQARMNSTSKNVYIPLSNAQRLLKQTAITSFYLAAEEDSVQEAQNTIDAYLEKKYGSDEGYNIINMSNIMDMMNSVMSTLSLMLGGIAAISLLVGGIGIMNIMLVSVTERTKEIGIRKAIGAQRSDITIQFMIESVFISLIGGIIGMVISQAVLSVLNVLFPDYHFAISLSVAALALGFSIGVGLIFGIYPANKAAKLKPINALRFE